MPHFDIVKRSNIENTFRVSKIQADFDVKPEHANEHFVGDITLPENWNIGVIVGASGTGKSTIANALFADQIITGFDYHCASVIDDMPNAPIDDITKMFYSVGFGSVPSWLKPYSVLSTAKRCALIWHARCSNAILFALTNSPASLTEMWRKPRASRSIKRLNVVIKNSSQFLAITIFCNGCSRIGFSTQTKCVVFL